jgi:hypothetical protein
MQTDNTKAQCKNIIQGRIIVKESGQGIPNLLVAVWHIGSNHSLEEVYNWCESYKSYCEETPFCGYKIASVLTSQNGSFSLSYEDSEFQISDEQQQRPNLFLMVFTPEQTGRATKDSLIYYSTEIRKNSARSEAFFIQVTADQLEAANHTLLKAITNNEQNLPDGEGDLDTLETKLKLGKNLADRKQSIFKAKVEDQYQAYASQRNDAFTLKFKENISTVPKKFRDSQYFVKAEESVEEKALTNVSIHLEQRFNNSEIPPPISSGFIYLTSEQELRYEQYLEGDEYVLPDDIVAIEILPKLFGGTTEGSSSIDFIMNHPAARACVKEIKTDLCPPPDNSDGGTIPIEITAPDPSLDAVPPSVTSADIDAYIARQMAHVKAPEDFGEGEIGVGEHGRADVEAITSSINKLEFKKGPADIPAYFDFHSLKIAFPHVWREAIDQGLIENGEALYDKVVAAGIDPTMSYEEMLESINARVNYFSGYSEVPVPPPFQVIMEFPDAVPVWGQMSGNEKTVLERIANVIIVKYSDSSADKRVNLNENAFYNYLKLGDSDGEDGIGIPLLNQTHLLDNHGFEVISYFRQKGQKIVDQVLERVEEAQELKSEIDLYNEAASLAAALKQNLQRSYSFTYFAANKLEHSVNFGVLLTYRQIWNPVNYQAGELVKTIPLAPKEIRKYSKKTVIKKTRSQKEIEDNLRITKTDASDTNRAEAEIVNKAQNKSTFSLNTVSTFDIPLGEASKIGTTATTNSTLDALKDSSETKKDFREAVIKASQEYKNERRLEVTSEESYESEITESGEISNPNDELTVTYLFYELQRQFKVNERLHRMRPVVLVAQEMPAPHQIDEDWIVAHDWILKRVLLDDSFLSAFDCIMSIRGDRLMLAEFEKTVKDQRKVVRDLRQNVKYYTDETGRLSRALQAAINHEAEGVEGRDIWDGIPLLGDRLDAYESSIKGFGKIFGFGTEDDPKDANRIRREAAKDSYERSERERRELMGRLERETGVLNGLTHDVAEKRKLIIEKEVLIARFENHLKDNILHYMQAIWTYEHADQRFFRLFNTKVPSIPSNPSRYNLRIKQATTPSPMFDQMVNVGVGTNQRKTRHQYTCSPRIQYRNQTSPLEEVADLDNLLGFKGNYMIFPMRKSNVLTDFMMAPYVDSEFQLLDPDSIGNWTLEEFEQLYCCLKQQLSEEEFSAIEDELKDLYKQILTDPLRPGELITVPTGSLFIEALPGVHPVLEDFKLLHRAVDVKNAQANVRKIELENIRYAKRIMTDKLDDPDVEKKIVVEGNVNSIVNPTE